MGNETQVDRMKNQQSPAIQKGKTLQDLVGEMLPEVQKAMATPEMANRFVRHIVTVLKVNPALLKCDPATFFGSMMMAATLNLMPNVANECFFIPFNDKKSGKTICQFIIGYKGFVKMFYRSNLAKICWHGVVYKNDIKSENDLMPFIAAHRGKNIRDTEEEMPVGYYAAYELTTGGMDYIYLTDKAIANIRKKSPARNSGPWVTDYIAMCIKTCYRHLMKYAPMETDLSAAVFADGSSKQYDKKIIDMPGDITLMPDFISEESMPAIEDKTEAQPGKSAVQGIEEVTEEIPMLDTTNLDND